MDNPMPRILRLKDVMAISGLSRSTIYDHMKKKNFPQPVKLGSHSVGWIESEIQEWIGHLIDARQANVAPF